MRRQKKHVPSRRIEQNSRKRTKQNGDNLLDAEFKTLVIRMLSELRGRVDKFSKNFNSVKKDMETIKKN